MSVRLVPIILVTFLATPALAEPLVVGTLQSDLKRVAQVKAAGVTLATVSISWDRFQPLDQRVDGSYVESLKKDIATFRKAGMLVQLDLGLQYPPDWVLNRPNARFVNQHGKPYIDQRPGANVVNAVFNQKMRDLQAAYVQALLEVLGGDFHAVRLGWNFFGELGYPPSKFKEQTNCYWAFDANAQGELPDLPLTLKACPLPGWKPGMPSHDHSAARTFLNWYLDALVDYQRFQVVTVRQHYKGPMVVLLGSWGIRPAMVEKEINRDLSRPQSELSFGYDFERLVNAIDDPKVAVCTTWIDANPKFGDDPPVAVLSTLAKAKKLDLWAENTGDADAAAMKLSIDRSRKYGVSTLVWAFEAELFDGKHAGLADLQSLMDERKPASHNPKP